MFFCLGGDAALLTCGDVAVFMNVDPDVRGGSWQWPRLWRGYLRLPDRLRLAVALLPVGDRDAAYAFWGGKRFCRGSAAGEGTLRARIERWHPGPVDLLVRLVLVALWWESAGTQRASVRAALSSKESSQLPHPLTHAPSASSSPRPTTAGAVESWCARAGSLVTPFSPA